MESKIERSGAARQRELNPHRALLDSLMRELFQTERSAELHASKEAQRFGDAPPARALRAVAQHAISVNAELPRLAEARDLPVSRFGRSLGAAFSLGRRWFADPAMEAERSYRATLLGMRHGVDLVRLIRATADAGGDSDLVAWCIEWLAVREPLVEEVCHQLEWFGWHPEPATRHRSRIREMVRRMVARGRSASPELTGARRA